MVGLGVYSFLTIPQRMVPKIPTPNIGVVTKFPGMSAEDMGRYITRPLEKRLQIAGGVQYVLGVSQAGYSKIVVYFRYEGSTRAPSQSGIRRRNIGHTCNALRMA